MWQTLINATKETLVMLAPSTMLTISLSLPIAILVSGIESKTKVATFFSKTMSFIVHALAHLPFLAIVLILMPVSNKLATYNLSYMLISILPLTIVGTITLSSKLNKVLRHHKRKLSHLTKSLGASGSQQLWLMVMPEAKTEILKNCLDITGLLLSATLICGIFGAGGLGQLAVDSSLGKYNPGLLFSSVAILLALQTLISYTSQSIITQKR